MRMIDLNGELTGIEILAPQTITSSGNGSAINLQGYEGDLKLIQDSTGTGASANTITTAITDSADGTNFAAVAAGAIAFPAIASAAVIQSLSVNTRGVRQYIRAENTV